MCWINLNIHKTLKLDKEEVIYLSLIIDNIQKEKGISLANSGLFTEEESIIKDCLWAISYIIDTKDDFFIGQTALHNDLLKQLIEFMSSKSPDIFVPAMRCFGHIATITDTQIMEKSIKLGVLDRLTNLLYTSSKNVIKECLWIISNICGGSSGHVTQIVSHDIFEKIVTISEGNNLELKKEAVWVITNAISLSDLITREKILRQNDFTVLIVLTNCL